MVYRFIFLWYCIFILLNFIIPSPTNTSVSSFLLVSPGVSAISATVRTGSLSPVCPCGIEQGHQTIDSPLFGNYPFTSKPTASSSSTAKPPRSLLKTCHTFLLSHIPATSKISSTFTHDVVYIDGDLALKRFICVGNRFRLLFGC